jgi:hypothetical protein
MSIGFSEDYIGSTVDSYREGIFRNSATEPASIGYYLTKSEIKSPKEVKLEEQMIDSFLRTPELTTGMRLIGNLPTDVATKNKLITGVIRTPYHEITSEVEVFISHQKKPIKFRNEVSMIAERVSAFLIKENIDGEVSVELSVDSEYSDWAEPKIEINVAKEQLGKAYDTFDNLLTYAFDGISQKTIRRISVNLSSRQC